MDARSEQVAAYVSGLDLPEIGPRFESAEPEAPVQFDASPQAVAVGAQVAAFSAAVSADSRSAIADSLLLAQLAADKAADSTSDVLAWYRKYVEVLKRVGWLVESMEFKSRTWPTRMPAFIRRSFRSSCPCLPALRPCRSFSQFSTGSRTWTPDRNGSPSSTRSVSMPAAPVPDQFGRRRCRRQPEDHSVVLRFSPTGR